MIVEPIIILGGWVIGPDKSDDFDQSDWVDLSGLIN